MRPDAAPPQARAAIRVAHGQAHHFFGYYDKTTWDRDDRYLLVHRVPFMDTRLTPSLEAEVGCIDLADGQRFVPAARTRAWNWQMGSQLQWLDGLAGSQCIYNIRLDDGQRLPGGRFPGFAAEIHDFTTGLGRRLPNPIYVAAPSSEYALCIDYRRLYVTHETIGYSETGGPFRLENAPEDDGIHRMEIASGATRLLVSYAALTRFRHRPSMDKAIHWISHIEINPSSSRVLFLHRWTERVEDETCFLHRLITMAPDGSDLRLLECSDHPLPQLQENFDPDAVGTYDYEKSEYQISHPLWRNDRQIIVWSPHAGEIHYHLYDDADGGAVQVVGRDILTENGHMSFSPADDRWLLSDTYPDPRTHERVLFLFDMRHGQRIDLGSFYADPELSKENRCDLHPRWRRDGLAVCIDSVHEHARQMYVIDVADITGRQPG